MCRPKVFVTRALLPEAVELLRSRCEVEMGPKTELDQKDLCQAVRGVDAVLAAYLRLEDCVLEAMAPTCKVIACYGVGYDHIPVATATRLGIWVTNNPGFVTEDTADFAMALLLGVARRLRDNDQVVRNRVTPWGPTLNTGWRVNGKTLGLVGGGRIALAVARRAMGFGMRLQYTCRHRNALFEEQTGAAFMERDQLLASSDFVSLHIPLAPETVHYIGARELGLMPRHSILINTARGGVVDEAALVRALRAGDIAGAGLDVFEHEPLANEGLCDMPNVLLAPHNGTGTLEGRENMGRSCAEKIFAALDGNVPQHCLNPEAIRNRKICQ
jgi:Lactate dehydrogenase and related dehydrogenases